MEALLREIDYYASLAGHRKVRSIFFGGGTPSLMAASTVEAVINRISEKFNLPETAEITLEANPTSVEAGKFADFAHAGVNRVSLGIQALNDKDLKALGREHSVTEAIAAIDLSQKYFSRSNFDLIYARMGQSLKSWEEELKQAINMANGHLSLYQLTIEMGTPFFGLWRSGKLPLPDERLAADMYDITNNICADAGYQAYEISNYAVNGQQSLHNLTYWQYQDYIGIGPGAHGRITVNKRTFATEQNKKPETWLKAVLSNGNATKVMTSLDQRTMAEEMIMMGLRLNAGIKGSDFEKRIGAPLKNFIVEDQLDLLTAQGFVSADYPDPLRLTASGRPLLNQILGRILV